jgi:hypothetical protein
VATRGEAMKDILDYMMEVKTLKYCEHFVDYLYEWLHDLKYKTEKQI